MMVKNKTWLLCASVALSLGLSACADNNDNGETPDENSTSGNNQTTANNQTTPSNNQTTANNQTTPTNNQTSGNNQTTANNQTTPTNNQTTGNTGNMTTPPNNNGGMCMDVTVYVDADGDGVGEDDGDTMMSCLLPNEQPAEGYARMAGDCDGGDPIAYTGAEGVCGDNVDDNCDGEDEECPASQPANLDVPDWDCQGDAPSNVYAYAMFNDGGGYLQDGGCFVFFEGAKGTFYSQKVGIAPAQTEGCDARYGCVCPSEGGWPSYDRRLYALTLSGEAADCEQLELIDHAGEDQPVSNSCRKYLYQLHRYDIPYSYVAGSMDALTQRLENFSTVEVACLRDSPHANLPFKSLLTAEIQLNPAYQAK